jgi:hypothetical protein
LGITKKREYDDILYSKVIIPYKLHAKLKQQLCRKSPVNCKYKKNYN